MLQFLGSDALNRAPACSRRAAAWGRCCWKCRGAPRAGGQRPGVDREGFAAAVTARLESTPCITLLREEATAIPEEGVVILASGPLTSPALAQALAAWTGTGALYFYDAIAPIVDSSTLNFDIAFRASRYARGDQEEGDYINCPMNKEEYQRFVEALLSAERIPLRDFERDDPHFFEACLPVEVLARRSGCARLWTAAPGGVARLHTRTERYAVNTAAAG